MQYLFKEGLLILKFKMAVFLCSRTSSKILALLIALNAFYWVNALDECDRDDAAVAVEERICERSCSHDRPCRNAIRECRCDGICGRSCLKPSRPTPITTLIPHNCDVHQFAPLQMKHECGVDLYFVFDSSITLGLRNFNRGKRFAKRLVKEIGVTDRSNSLRVGALYFNAYAQVAFDIIDYDATSDVVAALNNIPYLALRGSNLERTMTLLRDRMSQRPRSLRVALLITDGGRIREESPVAEQLKWSGFKIYCVGLSEYANRYQLTRIASYPRTEYLFFLKDYDRLTPLIKALTNMRDYSECGVSRYGVPPGLVEGEVPAAEGAWPWQVYMEIHPKHSSHYEVCGGTVLRNDTILTAAHCVMNFTYLEAFVGITNRIHDRNYQWRRLNPSDVTIHERYDDYTHSHNIALIHLDQPLTMTQNVSAACLPNPERAATLLYTRSAIVTGWGHGGIRRVDEVPYGGFQPVDHLQQLPLLLKSREMCEESLQNKSEAAWWDETMICAGYNFREFGACEGDSGGPLIKYANSGGERRWTIIGITSWRRGCAALLELDFFTNVPYFVDWINQNMNSFQNEAASYQWGRQSSDGN